MSRIERIVVGTDFSDIAEHALEKAVELAAQLGASLTVVHAYELPMYSFPDAVVVSTPEIAADITAAGQRGLDAVVERWRARGVPMKTLLRMGAAWEELCSVAKEESAGLIVVGTHGRRALARALLGSVTERLLRSAELPVLVVRRDGPT